MPTAGSILPGAEQASAEELTFDSGRKDARPSGRREVDIGTSVRSVKKLSIRAVLFIGFGLTAGIWAFAGIYFSGRIAELDTRTTEVGERYVRGQELLNDARTQVMLSSVYIRDALLDAEAGLAERSRQATTAALASASYSLSQYVPILDSPDEQARVARLLLEISELQETMLDMLATDSRQWQTMAGAFLRGQLAPRREVFMTVATELGMLNRSSFVAHQLEMVEVYRETQRRVWLVLGATLAASLGIAVLSTVYAGRLEWQVKLQVERDAVLQRGLQRLSADLIRVREQEQRALARELHDEIGQSLTAIKFELAAAQRVSDEHGGPRDLLGDVRPIVERTLQAVRDMSHMLHPSVLDDLGLVAAVDLRIKEFRRRHAIRVELVQSGVESRLPREVETAAYRVVQEALTNVAKHAKATSCRVSLTQLAHSLVVVVGDDGRGFEEEGPATSADGRGLGLVSMRERAMQLGGNMVVETAPQRGTRIVVELPIDSEWDGASTLGASQPREREI